MLLEKVKRDRQLYLFLTICYSLLLAVLACTTHTSRPGSMRRRGGRSATWSG